MLDDTGFVKKGRTHSAAVGRHYSGTLGCTDNSTRAASTTACGPPRETCTSSEPTKDDHPALSAADSPQCVAIAWTEDRLVVRIRRRVHDFGNSVCRVI